MPEAKSLLDLREFGHAQRQPLGAVTRKVHLRTGIVAHTFNADHSAFAKLGMEHLHTTAYPSIGATGHRRCTLRHGLCRHITLTP